MQTLDSDPCSPEAELMSLTTSNLTASFFPKNLAVYPGGTHKNQQYETSMKNAITKITNI